MYEGDMEGDFYDDSDDRRSNGGGNDGRLIGFEWSEDARNDETGVEAGFEKTILVMLDIINGDFIISSDLTSGGDGSEGNDFMSDMSQENGSHDMMNDANAEVAPPPPGNGPGPKQQQPTVTNNSSYPIYILHTVENFTITLQPGGKFYDEFDGIAMPHLYQDKVLKVTDFNKVDVTNKGYDVDGTKLLGSIGQAVQGGLKDKSWLKQFEGIAVSTPRGTTTLTPRDSYSSDHWGALFKVLGISVKK